MSIGHSLDTRYALKRGSNMKVKTPVGEILATICGFAFKSHVNTRNDTENVRRSRQKKQSFRCMWDCTTLGILWADVGFTVHTIKRTLTPRRRSKEGLQAWYAAWRSWLMNSLKRLGLYSHERRRKRGDRIGVFKIVNQFENVDQMRTSRDGWQQ